MEMAEKKTEKIIEEKEIKNQKTVSEVKNNEMAKTIVFTCLKTLLCLFVCILYAWTIIFCLSPEAALKINQTFGFKGVETACYERIYLKSEKTSELYNLIEVCIKNNDYNKTVKYIDQMRKGEDYAEFCSQVNTAAVANTSVKYVAFVGDYESYLTQQKCVALYKVNKKSDALQFALNDLAENTNKYSIPLASYVELLSAEKDCDLSSLMSTTVGEKTVENLISEKISVLDYSSVSDNKEKVMCIYALLKIEKVRYVYFNNIGDQSNATASAQRISDLQSEYNAVVNG